MKRKLIAVGLVLALGALVVSRLVSPGSGEARMNLYQRHPWPQRIRGTKRA
jgi:hypothetical protein